MPFWRAFYHLVWATKNRGPLIQPEIESSLYAYLVGKAAELGVFVYAINGWTDHVHLIVGIPPQVSVSDLVKHLKGSSSHELNQSRPNHYFAWQRGFGVLTVGERQRPAAELYVRQQKDHHAASTTQAWLERCSETDDGPEEAPASLPSPSLPAVREQISDYDTPGKPPF